MKKLEEIDRQRREKFMDMRRKTRDRIQIKRDLERERLRKKKCDDERQVRDCILRNILCLMSWSNENKSCMRVDES